MSKRPNPSSLGANNTPAKRRITRKSRPEIERVKIDPDGDLSLILAKGKRKANIEVHVLVSSKHMTLASSVFKAMLAPNHFQEGTTLALSGKAEISLPDDDTEAFVVLLNVIHARSKFIPSTVSLEQLTKIAVLVDKYRLHGAVSICTDLWVQRVESSRYCYYHLHISQWLCICWVFQKKVLFRSVTEQAITESAKGLTDSMENLPTPKQIIG